MAHQNSTTEQISSTSPDWARRTAATIARHAVTALVRTAAALMAGWSLYAVARHYGVPWALALAAGLVFDGVAYLCLRSASDAIRAARTAAPSIIATLGMATISGYLNLVHADITHGGRPAEVLYASPSVGFLLVSAIAWNDDRAAAKAARGESAFRLPSFGFWGWTLAHEQATTAVRERAIAHVTSGASATHSAAVPIARKDHRALLRERFAAMDPADAIEIAASSHPDMSPAELAEMLATYGITVSTLDVAFILGEAAVPSVTLDRVDPPQPTPVPALGAKMRPTAATNAPLVKGLSKADAIVTMAQHLGGLKTPAEPIALALAKQDITADLAYIRDRLSKARRAEEEAAAQAAAESEQERADDESRRGTGGYY